MQAGVPHEDAGEQAGLAEDLEPVADAEHGDAGGGPFGDRAHDRRARGDGPGAQIVAIGEAAGEDDEIDRREARCRHARRPPASGRMIFSSAASMSRSRLEPGKTTTADFTGARAEGGRAQL